MDQCACVHGTFRHHCLVQPCIWARDPVKDNNINLQKCKSSSRQKQQKIQAKDVLPNIPHAGHRKAKKCRFYVPGDLDLYHLNSSEQGTKHVFRVNLAQIRSVVPEIIHTQTKNTDWRSDGVSTKNRIFRSSLHAVKINQLKTITNGN